MLAIATAIALALVLPPAAPIEPVQFRDGGVSAASADAAERQAARHLDIGRHYFDEREFFAALDRLKVVVTKFQDSRHAEEALALIAEASLALGHDAEAQTASAVLARAFPHGRWAAAACDSLRAARLEPIEDQTSWISRAFVGIGPLPPAGRAAAATTGASRGH